MLDTTEQKWGNKQNGSTECDCGEDSQTIDRLQECLLIPEPCRPDDLAVAFSTPWPKRWKNVAMRDSGLV